MPFLYSVESTPNRPVTMIIEMFILAIRTDTQCITKGRLHWKFGSRSSSLELLKSIQFDQTLIIRLMKDLLIWSGNL